MLTKRAGRQMREDSAEEEDHSILEELDELEN